MVLAAMPGSCPTSASPLDRLPEELLDRILRLFLYSDHPFHLDMEAEDRPDFPDAGEEDSRSRGNPTGLASSTLRSRSGDRTLHQCDSQRAQAAHRADWIVVNSTNRRIRRLGKAAFFETKIVAMKSDTIDQLQRGGRGRRFPPGREDQELALACTRRLVVVDGRSAAPMWYVRLPSRLAAFPQLRRCIVTYGCGFPGIVDFPHTNDWMMTAAKLSCPLPLALRDLLVGMGVSHDLAIEWAVGPRTTWDVAEAELEKYVYPILRMKTSSRKQ